MTTVSKRIPGHQIPGQGPIVQSEKMSSRGGKSSSSDHVAMIDRLRLLAMFDIVAYHVLGPLPGLNGLGLPAFLLLSVAFSVVSVERHGLRSIAARKIRHIGTPWLFWWIVYAIFFVLLAIRRGEPIAEVFNPRMVLYGPSAHLWFCPFIILAGVGVAGFHRWTSGQPHIWKVLATLAIAYIVLIILSSEGLISRYGMKELPEPFWQWYFSAPSLLLGLVLGWGILLAGRYPRLMTGLALIAILIAVFSVEHFAVRHGLRRYSVSFAIILAAFVVDRYVPFRDWITTHLTPTLLGVYLVHIIYVYLLYNLLHKHHFLFSLVVFVVSVVTIAVMRRTRLRIFV